MQMTTQNPNQSDLLRGSVLPNVCDTGSTSCGSIDVSHQLPAADDSGLRHKVDNLKTRGLGLMQNVQQRVMDRSETIKRSLSTKVSETNASVRGGVQNGMTQVQRSMHDKPMMWAGIAGGTGMVLGLIGRFVHWRSHRAMPELVIIDATC